MEDDTRDFCFCEMARLYHVPRDCLTLTVGVSREEYLVGFFCAALNLCYHMLLTLHHLVVGSKSIFNIYRLLITLGEIAYVSNTRNNLVPFSKILRNSLRFGW